MGSSISKCQIVEFLQEKRSIVQATFHVWVANQLILDRIKLLCVQLHVKHGWAIS